MYRANPRVNVELRQRLPSPTGLQLSNSTQQFSNSTQQRSNYNRLKTSFVAEDLEWTQGPQHLHDTPTSPSPLSQRRSLSPPTSPLSQRRSPSPSSSRSPGGAGGMEVDLYPSQGPSPRADTWANGPDRDGSSSAPGSPAVRRHLVNTEDSVHQETTFVPNTSGRVLTLDRDKNICFLLKELDTLRQINNELQLQLVQKEKDLQSRKVQEELRMEQQEVMSWERPAAMLEEVLAAQKDRDHAMMSRLLLANEERDEALLRAHRLQQAAASELGCMPLDENDMDVDELLQCVCAADSVQKVEEFGSVLVQRLQLARQRRDDITAEEMQAVMEERDGSLAKCKRLEQHLIQEREHSAKKEELLRLQQERDDAVEDRQSLEAKLQVLQANQSSQVLLQTMDSTSMAAGVEQSHPLLLQLQQLSREKQSVEAELQRCQEAEREASERVHKLERLVEVLRKKVGTGNVRAV